MDEDIFESIADLEKRSDEVIERARLQAVELRAEVERKLQALGDELEHDYNLPREQIERELEKRRQQIFRDFEARTRASLTRLSADKREKIAPIIERVIKAFLESAHGN
jgi:vacuolar-type H+-ATPase subunit H